MKTSNDVMIYGTVTSIPKTEKAKTGRPMTTFDFTSVPTDMKNTSGDTVVFGGELHMVTAFGRLAEIALKHLQQGKSAILNGRVSNGKIILSDFQFIKS